MFHFRVKILSWMSSKKWDTILLQGKVVLFILNCGIKSVPRSCKKCVYEINFIISDITDSYLALNYSGFKKFEVPFLNVTYLE